MSADIYTKGFDDAKWGHALKLINVFFESELSPAFLLEWIEIRKELANEPPADDRNVGWSKAAKKKSKAEVLKERRASAKQAAVAIRSVNCEHQIKLTNYCTDCQRILHVSAQALR